jgi:hypothetical protein
MRPRVAIKVVLHVFKRRKLTVQLRRRHGHRMSARTEAADRLEWVAIAAQVRWQEQVAGEQDGATHHAHA